MTPGSKAYQGYDKYKSSNTIGEATQQGTNWQDLTVDFEKGWLTTPNSPGIMDVDAPSGAKRVHREGAPDREATSRAKTFSKEAEHHQHFLSFARSSHLDPKRTWGTYCSSQKFTIFYKC